MAIVMGILLGVLTLRTVPAAGSDSDRAT
jgi:hypothetical protein